MPHGHCYFWKPEILWLHTISDALIALSYFSIPVALLYFIKKRKDVEYHWIFGLFAAFIFACGTTHVLEIWTIWHGTYRLTGLVKLFTAIISISTAWLLWPLIPKLLALPSPSQLSRSNRRLAEEISERTKAEFELLEIHRELEARIHQRTAELEKATDLAVKALEAKSNFLANMSHEIRTPLNSIIGFAEVAHSTQLTVDKRSECIETILINGRHLLQIINDILDFSKIEAQQLEIERQSFSPLTLISEIESSMQIAAHNKGIHFETNYIFPLPERIESDPTRIRQILFNLLGNAIKFTDEGSVSLTIRSNIAENEIIFEIADTGIGISDDEQSHLFKPFSQADGSTTRKFGGTGLGLAISKRITEKLGGTIICQSKKQLGSTFIVSINAGDLKSTPLLKRFPSRRWQLNTAGKDETPVLHGRALVVDDCQDNQDLASLLLEQAGVEVTVASNGVEAINKISNETFDLILMDMQMPVMDGTEAVMQLREKGVSIPILAVTASIGAELERGCLNLGCNGYLSKPFYRKDFYAKISPYLQQKEDELLIDSQTKQIDSQLRKISAINKRYNERLPIRIEQLKQAASVKDWDEIHRLVHLLKNAPTFGCTLFEPQIPKLREAISKQNLGKVSDIIESLANQLESSK